MENKWNGKPLDVAPALVASPAKVPMKRFADADAIVEELNKLALVKITDFDEAALPVRYTNENATQIPKDKMTSTISYCVKLGDVLAIIEKARLRGETWNA